MKATRSMFLAILMVATPLASLADETHHSAPAAASSQQDSVFSEGEVRKVDLQQGKVTLRHGAIANLGMTPMTMVFRLADASVLPNLKVGDKVKFKAERRDGAITVTEIAPAN